MEIGNIRTLKDLVNYLKEKEGVIERVISNKVVIQNKANPKVKRIMELELSHKNGEKTIIILKEEN